MLLGILGTEELVFDRRNSCISFDLIPSTLSSAIALLSTYPTCSLLVEFIAELLGELLEPLLY